MVSMPDILTVDVAVRRIEECRMRRVHFGQAELETDGSYITVRDGENQFFMDDDAADRMAEVCKVPAEISKFKGDPDLMNRIWRYGSRMVGMYGFGFGPMLGMFGKADRPLISEHIEDLKSVLGGDGKVIIRRLDPAEQWLDWVTAEEKAIRVGDVSQVGVSIRFEKRIQVNPYMLRLACTNGLMLREKVKVKEVVQFRDALTAALDEAKTLVPLMEHASGVRVENPEQFLVRLVQARRITEGEMSEIIEILPEIEGHTLYDILQLVTRYARDLGGKDRARALMLHAGDTLVDAVSTHRCAHCQSVL